MTYHSKRSSIKTNLWNSLYILWKSEIINRKKHRNILKTLTLCILNHTLVTIHCLLHSTNTCDTSYKKLPYSGKKEKKISASFKNIAKKSKLSFENKIQMSVWMLPNISSFRKLSSSTGGSTVLS